MPSLQQAITTTAIAAATLIGVSLPAMADVVTITDFQGTVTPQGGNGAVESLGTTAVTLAGPVSFNLTPNTPQGLFTDTASVVINNGATVNGTVMSFGTLSNLLAQGDAGNLSFNVSRVISDSTDTAPNPLPYWQVVLKDPNNSANTIMIHGSGATGLGANALLSSGTVLGTLTSGGVFNTSTTTWSQLASLVSDGTALGNWNIVSVGIGEEGQTTVGANQVAAQIDSLTVGTTSAVAAVPEASTWAMLVLGFAGLGLLSYRRGT
jgi:hypothetical protein